MSALCLLVLLLFAGQPTGKPSPSPSPAASPPAPPTVAVSLERSVIREDDNVPVSIWVSNSGSQALSDVQLNVTRPGFLNLSTSQCDGKLDQGKVIFGNLPANSSMSCTLNLVTTKNQEIVVGEYSLLFTFQYQWKDNNSVYKSVVTAEKPLKVNLLGTDSVAGIPLALAGFIVPGLFFWIAIRVLKVPWGVDLPVGDKTIYSIIISSFFMAVGSWYNYFNVNNGISLNKLLKLAGAGFIAGVAVAGAYHAWYAWRRRREAAYQINYTDGEKEILGKILKRNSHYNPGKLRRLLQRFFPAARYTKPETLVRLRDNKRYVGALAVRDPGSVVLLGWFQVKTDGANDQIKKAAKQLAQDGKFVELYQFAIDNNLTIDVYDQIREISDASAHQGAMLFNDSDVTFVRTAVNKRAIEPLSVT